ncbi:10519_t:CDS:2 [Paraglomus brasilianum]|uniref:10519_t:CDS:1 n=1 Tax=Paraglomus brasilianum TaxID=144538 RepID=A0A9N8VNK0_9GLOM|nr:10519_t:CDS:2 [Paraglomus brasilianum]
MVEKCLFCVDLRPATLTLAVLGMVSNFLAAIARPGADEGLGVSIFLTVFYLLAALLCFCGFYGVQKGKFKLVKAFAILYWAYAVTLLLSIVLQTTLLSLTVSDDCSKVDDCSEEIRLVIAFVITATFWWLLQFHFCLVVWSYYKRMASQQEYQEILDSA